MLNTEHKIYYSDARELSSTESESVNLIVTSPPYPMISMWDDTFIRMNPNIGQCLKEYNGLGAYRLMHSELAKVWREIYRVLAPGGFACVNIGDATRNIRDDFKLYPNHADVILKCTEIGFDMLPEILWRKPTNSPTKFLGSGMLPCGAYVTLEHEAILVMRKPQKRTFKSIEEKEVRNKSSYFWEERNKWFSDIWELNGVKQELNSKDIRKRSGAFPFEIPYRLINMFSSKNDTVLDPFTGTGTTTIASIVCGRNSIGYEIDSAFSRMHKEEILSNDVLNICKRIVENRVKDHLAFIKKYLDKKQPKYQNKYHAFEVITRQEIFMQLDVPSLVKYVRRNKAYVVEYSPFNIKEGLEISTLKAHEMGSKNKTI